MQERIDRPHVIGPTADVRARIDRVERLMDTIAIASEHAEFCGQAAEVARQLWRVALRLDRDEALHIEALASQLAGMLSEQLDRAGIRARAAREHAGRIEMAEPEPVT